MDDVPGKLVCYPETPLPPLPMHTCPMRQFYNIKIKGQI